MLDQADAVAYLLHRGLLTPSDVVDGGVVVHDASSRNRNFKVRCSRGPSYLLKQGLGADGVVTVANEARTYGVLSNGASGLRRSIPKFFGYDSDERVLVIELLPGARDLHQYHRDVARFPVGLAGWIGRALGTLHRETAIDANDGAGAPDEEGAPWAASIHRPSLEVFRDSSAASLELIRIVQGADDFGPLLDEVRQAWRISALLHHDVKWGNVLACRARASGRITCMKLIDWEIAAPGDPAWDIGSVFGSYLTAWLSSIPVTGPHPPARYLELADYPLAKMQPAMRRCWAAYTEARGGRMRDASRQLVRAVQLAAVRLVQTAFEATQGSERLTSTVALHLQMSHNMLRRPQEAAVHLLGIPAWEPARRPA